jgi:beta-lactamase superfamily II metal-dependent hydrolase
VIVDAHVPECDDVTPPQIEQSLDAYLAGRDVRGLILTGLDSDHACPAGVDSILTRYVPSWVMYPTYYKDTETATEVFKIIERHQQRRANTARPLVRHSVSVDGPSRLFTGLATYFTFELFSPHVKTMNCSNNSSIVMKITGLDSTGFSYLITGDTETDAWDRINGRYGAALAAPIFSAPHHGAKSGCNPTTVTLVDPHTVLISAGVNNAYGHPDPAAVRVYAEVARVYSTNQTSDGTCLFTRRVGDTYDTQLVAHFPKAEAA